MSEEGRGKRLLRSLADTVRERVTPTGAALLERRGLLMIEEMARELTGLGAMPGLTLYRDAPGRFHLRRHLRNAEIGIEWQRDVGAIVLTAERHAQGKKTSRYVFDENQAVWRGMESGEELYEGLTIALTEYLYPEAKG